VLRLLRSAAFWRGLADGASLGLLPLLRRLRQGARRG
jgi:hypothetical protein